VGAAPGVDFGQAGKRAVRFNYASSDGPQPGLNDPEASMMDWPLPAPLHLDTIGYKLPPVKMK
jgi:hypothetical protein